MSKEVNADALVSCDRKPTSRHRSREAGRIARTGADSPSERQIASRRTERCIYMLQEPQSELVEAARDTAA